MRELLAEILRYVELEHVQGVAEVPLQLKELVVPCSGGGSLDYYAVDSGYVVRRIGAADVLIQTVVAVGRDIKRRFVCRGWRRTRTGRRGETSFCLPNR